MIFENFRKTLEMVKKQFLRSFYIFFIFSENLPRNTLFVSATSPIALCLYNFVLIHSNLLFCCFLASHGSC